MKTFFTKKTDKYILEVRHWFGGDKVVLSFGNYDVNKPKGKRMNGTIDFYFSIPAASYLGHMLSDRIVFKGETYSPFLLRALRAEAERAAKGDSYAQPIFTSEPSGYTSDGTTRAKSWSIEVGKKYPLIIRAFEGPGHRSPTGGYIPDFKWKDAETTVIMGLSEADSMALGMAMLDAVELYYRAYGKTFLKEVAR